MSWKKLYVSSASFLYLILISLFAYFFRTELICRYDSPCLSFCSTDTDEYSDKMLFDEFQNSNITYWARDDFKKTFIFRGLPYCNGEIKVLEYDEKNTSNQDDDVDDEDVEDTIDFYDRLFIYEDGRLYKNSELYPLGSYCLKMDANSTHNFVPMVCIDDGYSVNQIILLTTAVISIIILTITLAVYVYFPKLHDFHGKMIICFLVSMISTYFTIPGFFHEKMFLFTFVNFMMVVGFSSGNVWLNSMVLNVYFRCRDFNNSKSRDGKFASYCKYVAIVTSIIILFIIWEYTYTSHDAVEFIRIVHLYFILNDFVLLTLTSFIIRNISKHIGFSERPRLEKEKKIFWIYVKLFAIMAMTWSPQIYALGGEMNYFGSLIIGSVMLFSACNITGLFLGRNKVRNLLSTMDREVDVEPDHKC